MLKISQLNLVFYTELAFTLFIETIVRKEENQIHSIKPSEFKTERSDDSNMYSEMEVHKDERLLNVVYANGNYFIY